MVSRKVNAVILGFGDRCSNSPIRWFTRSRPLGFNRLYTGSGKDATVSDRIRTHVKTAVLLMAELSVTYIFLPNGIPSAWYSHCFGLLKVLESLRFSRNREIMGIFSVLTPFLN